MVKKYCKTTFVDTWYIDMFSIIKNEKKWGYDIDSIKKMKKYEKLSDTMKDLRNIIKLIQAGYKGYQEDMTNIIFILMPWSKENSRLLYFLKKMLKCKILDANITNISGAYPIEHAIVYDNYEAVKILVENGNALKSLTNDKLNILISLSYRKSIENSSTRKKKYSSHIYTYLVRYENNMK
jgi:ankyrin repeat protein